MDITCDGSKSTTSVNCVEADLWVTNVLICHILELVFRCDLLDVGDDWEYHEGIGLEDIDIVFQGTGLHYWCWQWHFIFRCSQWGSGKNRGSPGWWSRSLLKLCLREKATQTSPASQLLWPSKKVSPVLLRLMNINLREFLWNTR